MIEVVLNDRLEKKVRVKRIDDDTIGDLKSWWRLKPVPEQTRFESRNVRHIETTMKTTRASKRQRKELMLCNNHCNNHSNKCSRQCRESIPRQQLE
ncbi:ubiquitin-like protein 5 [Gossypium australe]|uniref:Ubiquitin-like protein 5 n=1 Tax=Gossypium australe TaxID=47621 RepID=A0A5B6WIC9_9ROSI|nr:ubiquitin-like protein 5 [Gossypium australe]